MKLKQLLMGVALSSLFHPFNLPAQILKPFSCGTDEQAAYLENLYPQSIEIRKEVELLTQHYAKEQKNLKISAPLLQIPVVVHILTYNGFNGILKPQILNGLQILNNDLRNCNSDKINTRTLFEPHAADLQIEFVLARLDPNGNPTEGINRVSTFTASQLYTFPISREEVKKAVPAWPTDKYFNIWLVEGWDTNGLGSGLLGYAQFPGLGNWNNYGVVMVATSWGKAGAVPGSTATSDGRVTTHEVGHCLNLYHTFQGGCGNSPATSGDFCGDTPPSSYETYSCDIFQNTCANDAGIGSPYSVNIPDQFENHMSYDLNCHTMFTNDQKLRSRAAFGAHSQLQNLVSASNAVATGLNPNVIVGPLLPIAYFAGNKTNICLGNAVSFTDNSYNGPPATSWSWNFPGGSPGASSLQNPVVTYAAPGKYAVTLICSNANGASQPVTETGYITVAPATGLVRIFPGQNYEEGFEDTNFPVNSSPNRTFTRSSTTFETTTPNWEKTNSASAAGNYSLRLRNNSITVTGTKSILITPVLDISRIPLNSVRASIDIAYAMKNAYSDDELRIYYSLDCGEIWNKSSTLSGLALTSNGAGNYVTGNFIPTSSQWNLNVNIPPINGLSNGTIMFKIEAVSKNGNNSLFIDTFQVWTTAIPANVNSETLDNNILVYPNPITAETGLSFELHKTEIVEVKIFDLVGNLIYNGAASAIQAGNHSFGISNKMKNTSAGMYMLQMSVGGKVYTTKLIRQ